MKKKKKKSSENDQLTGHFQSFFIYFIFVPSTFDLKKKSCKSTNKKNLALPDRLSMNAPKLSYILGKKNKRRYV